MEILACWIRKAPKLRFKVQSTAVSSVPAFGQLARGHPEGGTLDTCCGGSVPRPSACSSLSSVASYALFFLGGLTCVHNPNDVTGTGKWVLWGSIVTHADDQLRQRVAWALSQILVIGDGGGELFYSDHTETWAAFYDTFITHAFGNYRDIMREVSASPLMGRHV